MLSPRLLQHLIYKPRGGRYWGLLHFRKTFLLLLLSVYKLALTTQLLPASWTVGARDEALASLGTVTNRSMVWLLVPEGHSVW